MSRGTRHSCALACLLSIGLSSRGKKDFSLRSNRSLMSLVLCSTFLYIFSSSRAVTRGVNKGVKEDFRAALERQIGRSDDSFEPLLRVFFQEEKESLLS